jgi:hypothetical protein
MIAVGRKRAYLSSRASQPQLQSAPMRNKLANRWFAVSLGMHKSTIAALRNLPKHAQTIVLHDSDDGDARAACLCLTAHPRWTAVAVGPRRAFAHCACNQRTETEGNDMARRWKEGLIFHEFIRICRQKQQVLPRTC